LVSSINSAVSDTVPALLGKGSKALTASNTMVKVWGKITQLVPNTGADSARYQYDYMVINDGGQDVKIPMHVQYLQMSVDTAITGLSVGDYMSVTGIATTTDGTDVVVIPRGVGSGFSDFTTYLDSGL
jgi:hypothetical protein